MNTIYEPDLKYCPQCSDEYRAEMTTCATCDLELITGVQMQAIEESRRREKAMRTLEIGPDEPMTTIRKGPVLQMKQLQSYLRRHGIPSLVVKEDSDGCNKGCCRGSELFLQVRTGDLQEVMAVLELEYRQSTGLSDHDTSLAGAVYNVRAEEATCPACGFRFATSSTTCPDCGLCFA